jgi:crotonobetainyl-CoA:carnitine CoA-transferase CaiB-like acyl-CoA transferase
MTGVFDDLRVLDLSSGIAGPMTTMLLADNGALVTRIRSSDDAARPSSAGERVWDRGKRSASLDVRSDDDRDAFLALAAGADVVVESFAPGTTAQLGIDHATLAATNAGLITCSITGYGRHVAARDRPADDALVAARTGLLYDQRGRRGSAMEYINGRPGPLPEFDAPEGLVRGAERRGPVFPRTPWPSMGAMYFATLGIAAALRARETTGAGQWVETSLLQGALAAVCLNWQRVEHPDAPLYWMWPVDSRSIEGLYECADGRWVHHWTVRPSWVLASAEADELGTVALDVAYRDDPDRVPMDADGLVTGTLLHPMLAAAFKKFPAASWVKAGEQAGIGVALVRSPGEALADESFLADGCVVEMDDPDVGRIRHVGTVLEFSATPGGVDAPAPRRGEHTADVLAESMTASSAPEGSARSVAGELVSPLEGVRVIDLGLGVAGPFTGRALADLGADVIKVHALHDTFWAGTHMGLGTNRGKRSIALNLKDERGRWVLDALVERADVVMTNWRPGAAARLGVDYDSLRPHHPRLVYCNTRGYEKGPRSDLPGTDQTAAALAGVEWEDGACDAGNPPLWSRSGMGDTGNALLAAIAIVAALYHRDRTGEGQAVSTSIVNAQLLHTSYAWIHADGAPADWGHVDGGQFGLSPFYRLYACADDRWLFVAAQQAEDQSRLGEAIGDDVASLDDAEKAAATLERRFLERPATDWFDMLDAADVPVEIVDEGFCRALFDAPGARATQLVAETWVSGVGRFEDPGLLVNLSDTPGTIQRGPCLCGEHSREILLEHGYTTSEIDELSNTGVVLDAAITPSLEGT